MRLAYLPECSGPNTSPLMIRGILVMIDNYGVLWLLLRWWMSGKLLTFYNLYSFFGDLAGHDDLAGDSAAGDLY